MVKISAQPVRTVPAPAPVENKTIKPVAKPKTVVIEKNKDSDGDGLVDTADKCPDVYGPPSNDGCPAEKEKDRDKDGVPDETDACPDDAGLSTANGCPPRASLKIVSDVNAKIYVDGVAKADIIGATPYLLQLDRGYFDIKVVSARYNVFEQKEGYKVENNSQQDYWKVLLKDDEETQEKIEKGRKMAQKAQALVSLINECMAKNSRDEWTESKYYLSLSNGKITYNHHTDFTKTADGRRINFKDRYVVTDVTTITKFYVAFSEQLKSYYAYIVGDSPERNVDHTRGEKVLELNWGYVSILLRSECALDLTEKIKKLLEE